MILSAHINAQDLSSHQWENRLVLILVDQQDNATYKRQLAEFRSAEAGMEERKLLVYHITPEVYRTGLDEQKEWKQGQSLFGKYKETESDFELLLIGLDGSVKLRSSQFLPVEALFDRIDSMPMRKEEMRKNKEE